MLAIIGGSGLYQLDGLTMETQHEVTTPFGQPSSSITEGRYLDQPVLFLARHGEGHQFLPHEVNYRANIFALKSVGARRILGFSAAGSLRKEIRPGELALTAQYFDHTRGKRNYSFFGDGVSAHISTAYPTCPALAADIVDAAARINAPVHVDKTYACVEQMDRDWARAPSDNHPRREQRLGPLAAGCVGRAHCLLSYATALLCHLG